MPERLSKKGSPVLSTTGYRRGLSTEDSNIRGSESRAIHPWIALAGLFFYNSANRASSRCPLRGGTSRCWPALLANARLRPVDAAIRWGALRRCRGGRSNPRARWLTATGRCLVPVPESPEAAATGVVAAVRAGTWTGAVSLDGAESVAGFGGSGLGDRRARGLIDRSADRIAQTYRRSRRRWRNRSRRRSEAATGALALARRLGAAAGVGAAAGCDAPLVAGAAVGTVVAATGVSQSPAKAGRRQRASLARLTGAVAGGGCRRGLLVRRARSLAAGHWVELAAALPVGAPG